MQIAIYYCILKLNMRQLQPFWTLLLLPLFVTLSSQLRIAVINDVHLNMTRSDLPDDLGRFGEDSTMELFDLMIEDLHNKYHH
jgi:hypothetical protein